MGEVRRICEAILSPVCDLFLPAFLFYEQDLLNEDGGRWPAKELTLNLREGVSMVSVRSGFT
jgi:hypothetical protein